MYRYGEEEVQAASRVLRSGQWFRYGDAETGHGGEANAFEMEWVAAMGTKHACFTSSGTAALICCLAGLGVGPGDEVIVPGYTWISTAAAPLAVGAIPIIVDIDESMTIDPNAIERALTPRTKVICPVHMNGLACDMDRIMEIARRNSLYVIEDACQCDGGYWTQGSRIGTLGDMGTYSFNVYKVVSCGDGGMYVTNNRNAYERGLIYHDCGVGFRAHAGSIGQPTFAGVNLRGNEILAAIMRVQLSRLDGIVADLHECHAAISAIVADVPEVCPIPYCGGEGTGTRATLGFRFANREKARSFQQVFNDLKVPGQAGIPINSGRHVYCNWEPVMEKRGGHHDAWDAFSHPLNQEANVAYRHDMLPRTLEILARTSLIGVNPDWTETELRVTGEAIRTAAAAVESVQCAS